MKDRRIIGIIALSVIGLMSLNNAYADLTNTVYFLRVDTLPLYPNWINELDLTLIGKDNTIIKSDISVKGLRDIPIYPYSVNVEYDFSIEVNLIYKWYKKHYHYFITLEITDIEGTLTVDNTVYDIKTLFNYGGNSKLRVYDYHNNPLDTRITLDLDLNDYYNNYLFDFRIIHYSVKGEVH